jgi:1,2-diacylglycerol 3-alpha-glucosyltransferase
MKIIHMCLSCFYIDGYFYQENEIIRQNIADGHDVIVIASTETYDKTGQICYVEPSKYIGKEGAKVIRLPYCSWLPHALMKKLRMHPRVYALLESIEPDVILFHGLCGWELSTAAKYKKNNPEVRLFADSHEDANNSARSFISKNLLHRLYYKSIISSAYHALDGILCISLETIEFVCKMYAIEKDALEFYPLGGRILDDAEYGERRLRKRGIYQISEDQVLFVQSGKMGKRKKVIESLDAFNNTKGSHLVFLLAGNFDKDIYDLVMKKIDADSRIKYIGWQSADELQDLLCAADVYVQPGTQSVTMQMSLCLRCPVVLDDTLSHQPYVKGNGWLLNDSMSLKDVFKTVADNSSELKLMSEKSFEMAKGMLDYKKLSSRIYSRKNMDNNIQVEN